MKRVIIYGALMLAVVGAIVSCQKDIDVEPNDDTLTSLDIFSTTKAGDGTEITEVLLTLYQNKSVVSSDTYTLGEDGSLTRQNNGIVASDGNYTLFVTSPADLSLDGTNGMKVYRTETDDDVNAYSGYQDISVEGIYSGTSTEKSYRLDLDLTLKKRVSGLKFTIASTDENNKYTINKVTLSNVLKTAYYLPVTKYIAAGENSSDDLESESYLFYPSNDTEGGFDVTTSVDLYEGGNSDKETFSLISGDYTNSLFSSVIPKLTIQFNDDDGKEIVVPLNINFEPQVNYTYSITLASTQINVKVTASDSWTENDNLTTSVETVDEYTLSYTEEENSWESESDSTTF